MLFGNEKSCNLVQIEVSAVFVFFYYYYLLGVL